MFLIGRKRLFQQSDIDSDDAPRDQDGSGASGPLPGLAGRDDTEHAAHAHHQGQSGVRSHILLVMKLIHQSKCSINILIIILV